MTPLNILIVGTGGREHTIAKALHKSEHLVQIYAVGGWENPGIAAIGHVEVLDIDTPQLIVKYAQTKSIDLAIIGSENQLEQGLADHLCSVGIFCVGPRKQQALLETDKVYARGLIETEYNPQYKVFTPTDYLLDALQNWLQELDHNYVIKAVGLRGGKGVKVSGDHLHSLQEADQYCRALLADDGRVLVEEKLCGEEFTLMAFADGEQLVNMPVVKDFKRLHNGDQGPNTGGMGCVSFVGGGAPFLTEQDLATAQQINRSTLAKLPGYVGILYGSFMKTAEGVKVIEYNCRFGDPEAINVLELLETDLVNIFIAMREKRLGGLAVKWSDEAMVTSYVVAPGYPDAPLLRDIVVPFSVQVIYAKITCADNKYTQLASRSFAVWSRGKTMRIAYYLNQALLCLIPRDNCHYRTDIGRA